MTEQEAAELDRWTETIGERSAIELFLDWLPGAGHQAPRFYMARADVFDEYYGVDRKTLESARRKLLAEARGEVAP